MMRKLLLAVGLLVGTLSVEAQPGELPEFEIMPVHADPIDETVMRIESLVHNVDIDRLEVDTLRDSAFYLEPFSPYSSWQLNASALPRNYKPKVVVYHREGEIEMIVFGQHTFHFLNNNLLRSWGHCSQVTAMGQCGGFVTTSDTYHYWNVDRIHRSISWQSHPHPCACYEQDMYDFETIMKLLEFSQTLLSLKDLNFRK